MHSDNYDWILSCQDLPRGPDAGLVPLPRVYSRHTEEREEPWTPPSSGNPSSGGRSRFRQGPSPTGHDHSEHDQQTDQQQYPGQYYTQNAQPHNRGARIPTVGPYVPGGHGHATGPPPNDPYPYQYTPGYGRGPASETSHSPSQQLPDREAFLPYRSSGGHSYVIPPPPVKGEEPDSDIPRIPTAHHVDQYRGPRFDAPTVEMWLRKQDFLRSLPSTTPIHLNSLQNAQDPNERPPYVMFQLAAVAIFQHDRKKASIAQIREAIEARFPFFKENNKEFKETLKHALSSYFLFKKVEKLTTEPGGRGGLWELDVITNPLGHRPRKRGTGAAASSDSLPGDESGSPSPPNVPSYGSSSSQYSYSSAHSPSQTTGPAPRLVYPYLVPQPTYSESPPDSGSSYSSGDGSPQIPMYAVQQYSHQHAGPSNFLGSNVTRTDSPQEQVQYAHSSQSNPQRGPGAGRSVTDPSANRLARARPSGHRSHTHPSAYQ